MLPEYEIASEHEHSNCVLIAHKKVPIIFKIRLIMMPLYNI